MEKILINNSGRTISIDAKQTGFFRRGFGLIFRGRNTENLVFDFKKEVYRRGALTSFFVFFNFLAIWLDNKNEVVEWRICKPFEPRIMPKNNFQKIVEIPFNRKNEEIIRFFVGKNGKI